MPVINSDFTWSGKPGVKQACHLTCMHGQLLSTTRSNEAVRAAAAARQSAPTHTRRHVMSPQAFVWQPKPACWPAVHYLTSCLARLMRCKPALSHLCMHSLHRRGAAVLGPGRPSQLCWTQPAASGAHVRQPLATARPHRHCQKSWTLAVGRMRRPKRWPGQKGHTKVRTPAHS